MASKFACSMALISGSYLPSKCGLWVASICVASMWLVRLRRLAGLPVHWRPCLASWWPPSMALTRLLILWFPCVFFLAAHERQLWSMLAARLPCLVFQMHRLCGFILSLLISIDTCASALLSWYALRGEALRPPPCTPPPAFLFNRFPLLPTILLFFNEHHRLFGSMCLWACSVLARKEDSPQMSWEGGHWRRRWLALEA